ncbi:MAG: hypothetical protein J6J18_07760 [Oscillospiraceae bacterium]|nr:hypothetical protein [Oscillospiraceae bacterium]
MKPYFDILDQYLAEHPLDYGYENINSLLELFARFYLKRHPIESTAFSPVMDSLNPILKSLSQKRTRRLFRIINDLCIEYEQSAFIEGIRVGAQLSLELTRHEDSAPNP